MSYYTDDVKYYWNGGDSMVGKPAILLMIPLLYFLHLR